MRLILVLTLFSAPALCQPVSIGVKGGALFDGVSSDDGRTALDEQGWTVGPTIEFALPLRLAIGIDALYRHSGFTNYSGFAISDSETKLWGIPVYVKYRFSESHLRPFVLAGIESEHATTTESVTCTSGPMICDLVAKEITNEKSSYWGEGFLLGAGVEFKGGALKIAPEFRYTHWCTGYFAGAGSLPSSYINSRNQGALLMGVRF